MNPPCSKRFPARDPTPRSNITPPTNLRIYRQDAKFAKVDIQTRKPQFEKDGRVFLAQPRDIA